jgi:hypothetical protein
VPCFPSLLTPGLHDHACEHSLPYVYSLASISLRNAFSRQGFLVSPLFFSWDFSFGRRANSARLQEVARQCRQFRKEIRWHGGGHSESGSLQIHVHVSLACINHHVPNLTLLFSSIDVTVGTPGQKLSLQVDTGPFTSWWRHLETTQLTFSRQ